MTISLLISVIFGRKACAMILVETLQLTSLSEEDRKNAIIIKASQDDTNTNDVELWKVDTEEEAAQRYDQTSGMSEWCG